MGKVLKQKVMQEMKFDGDILITDPCYIENKITDQDRRFPHVRFIANSTVYGDWSCHVWKANDYTECITDNVIGRFCADDGMVIVADYNQIKEYNPEVEQWVKEHRWCATVIKGFKGTVQMIFYEREYVHAYDWEADKTWGHKKGDTYVDRSLELHGKGNINWIGAQTGL